MAADVVLLHGAWCGPWCWEQLIMALAARDISAVAPELPIADPTTTLDDHLQAAARLIDQDRPPVVVGHSFAGVLMEPLAAVIPTSHLIYLAALIPVPGMSMARQWHESPEMMMNGWDAGTLTDVLGRTYWADPAAAIDALMQDCDSDTAARAVGSLSPQAWQLSRVRFDGLHQTPCTYVTATDDHLLNSSWLQRQSRSVLRAEPITLGTGHFPMLSAVDEVAETISQRVLEAWPSERDRIRSDPGR